MNQDFEINQVRDWAAIAPDHATFKNCYRVRKFEGDGDEGSDEDGEQKPVPHTFVFAKRSSSLPCSSSILNYLSVFLNCSFLCLLNLFSSFQLVPLIAGLPSALALSERCPRAWKSQNEAGARDDLFCLVKSEMSSNELSQLPLLVWPAALLQQSKRFLEIGNRTSKVQAPSFDVARRQEISRLAAAIRVDFPQMARAAAWYEWLLQRDPVVQLEPFRQLAFLRNVPDDGASVHDFRFGAPRLARAPYNLEVVFHRQSL